MSQAAPIVGLLTDFGLQDHFVGTVKGVILGAVPGAQVVDICHDIPPQDVRFAAFQLLETYRYFPPETFFLCVVDPGVGSSRKILYAEAGGFRFIAPDNGLLSWVFLEAKPQRVFNVSNAVPPDKILSATFHARDVMAPLVGRLLTGESPSKLGETLSSWEKIIFPVILKTGSQWMGEVLMVDRFGNLITNVRTDEVLPMIKSAKIWIELGDKHTVRGLSKSYGEVDRGKLVAVGGSSGFVEVAVREGSAAQMTGLRIGSKVSIQFRV